MMKETDIIKMEINIAGERLFLPVAFREQDNVREAEKRVGDLFQSFSARYPGKAPIGVLAMVAYDLSAQFCELQRQTEASILAARKAESHIAALLRGSERTYAFGIASTSLSEKDAENHDSKGSTPTESETTDYFTSY